MEEVATMQGVKVKNKVKVVTLDNETQKHKYVIAVNDEYLELERGRMDWQKPLKQQNLKTVKILDTVATLVVGTPSFISILVITVVVIVAIEGGIGYF